MKSEYWGGCPEKSDMLQKYKSIVGELKQVHLSKSLIKNEQLVKKIQKDIITSPQMTLQRIDQMFINYPIQTEKACALILNQPTTKQPINSKNIEQKLSLPMKVLKQTVIKQFQKYGIKKQNPLIFTEESSIKTQLSLKILCNQFKTNKMKFCEKIQENQNWKYNELEANEKKLQQFQNWYIDKISKEYQIPNDQIYLIKISKGSILIQFATINSHTQQKIIKENKKNKKLTICPYFQKFHLSPEDFCEKGDFKFGSKQQQQLIDWRGCWPYFRPILCDRYGINVSRRYDNKNDRWLQMSGKKGEWPVAYHGVRSENIQQKNALSSIMKGLQSGQMLKKGSEQAYEYSKALNNNKQQIGQGIYCTPYIQVALKYYTGEGIKIQDQTYYLIFQCRINPNSIKVCDNDIYWVVNESSDIRPYGIILIKGEEHKKNYPNFIELYGQKNVFRWDTYESQIKQRIAKMEQNND